MVPVDLHTHTLFSFDGVDSVNEMCEAAIDNGILVLATTEHCDFTAAGADPYFLKHNCPRRAAVNAARLRYDHHLTLLRGVEMGQAYLNREAATKILKDNPFDIVLGAVHLLPDGRDVFEIDYSDPEVCEDVMSTWLQQVWQAANFTDYDSLAHIDFPYRRMERAGIPYTLKDYEEQVREIVRSVAQKERALEINTRGIRCWHGQICPEPWVLTAFKEYGGQYVTVGSDSHNADYVGYGAGAAYALLKKCGFESVTYYVERQPTQMPLL